MLPDLLPAHKSGVGVGWVITYMTRCCYLLLHFSHIRHATLLQWGGVALGWGAVGNNVHETLLLSSLALLPHRSCYAAAIFSCTVPHTSCYASAIFSCTFPHMSCYASAIFFCTFPHMSCYDMLRFCNLLLHCPTYVKLRFCNLLLHFPTYVMLRFCNSINSTVGGKPNKNLWMYMRSQQWRWECHDKDILAFTGQTLANL